MAKGNRVLWVILILFLVFFFAGIVVVGAVVMKVAKTEKVENDSVLELTFSGPLTEGPGQNPLEEMFAEFEGSSKISVWSIRQALERAATDDKIVALRLNIESAVGGPAVVEEIHDVLGRFRESGKPIYAYIKTDFADDSSYWLATAADKIWLSPEAGVIVNGLRFEVTFWRGTLDKLHIEPHYIMFKEYKSAGEPMSRYEMSKYYREHLTALGEDIQNRIIDTITERRGLERAAVEAAVNDGMMTSTDALEAGWLDRLGYADELEQALVEATRLEEYEEVSVGKYLKQSKQPASLDDADRIALVFGEGPIYAVGEESPFGDQMIIGAKVAKNIEEAAEDESVKAIVFRVNSPGGSAVGSDHIWRAIEKVREAGKPIVVSMSTVAGSGGYWISMGADKIVAQPTSITGSIGVVFGKLNLRGFYEWIGANISDVTLARNADILSFVEPLKPEHEARFRGWMEAVYESFKGKVAEGRGLEVSAVEEIAKGHIWSGIDAKELGLVDELGGLDVAFRLARELASLPDDAGVQVYPKAKNFFEMLAAGEFSVRTAPQLKLFDLLEAPGRNSFVTIPPQLLLEADTPRPWVFMPSFRLD